MRAADDAAAVSDPASRTVGRQPIDEVQDRDLRPELRGQPGEPVGAAPWADGAREAHADERIVR